jgi:hypothetical protein
MTTFSHSPLYLALCFETFSCCMMSSSFGVTLFFLFRLLQRVGWGSAVGPTLRSRMSADRRKGELICSGSPGYDPLLTSPAASVFGIAPALEIADGDFHYGGGDGRELHGRAKQVETANARRDGTSRERGNRAQGSVREAGKYSGRDDLWKVRRVEPCLSTARADKGGIQM